MRNREQYQDFLKCLSLFSEDIISKGELLNLVADSLSRHPDLAVQYSNTCNSDRLSAANAIAPWPLGLGVMPLSPSMYEKLSCSGWTAKLPRLDKATAALNRCRQSCRHRQYLLQTAVSAVFKKTPTQQTPQKMVIGDAQSYVPRTVPGPQHPLVKCCSSQSSCQPSAACAVGRLL